MIFYRLINQWYKVRILHLSTLKLSPLINMKSQFIDHLSLQSWSLLCFRIYNEPHRNVVPNVGSHTTGLSPDQSYGQVASLLLAEVSSNWNGWSFNKWKIGEFTRGCKDGSICIERDIPIWSVQKVDFWLGKCLNVYSSIIKRNHEIEHSTASAQSVSSVTCDPVYRVERICPDHNLNKV